MKLAVTDDYSVVVAQDGDGHLVVVDYLVHERWRHTKYAMNHVIEHWADYRPLFDEARHMSEPKAFRAGSQALRSPVPSPTNLIAAPLNYRPHIAEMTDSTYVGDAYVPRPPSDLGFFLKSVSSVCGPKDAIMLPSLVDREFHFEGELAVIIGREARHVGRDEAADYVFGYTCLLDITLRNTPTITNERSMRKSFDTFTPMGPHVVTRDEVGSDDDLDLTLRVNEEIRQKANTRDLITPVAELIEIASGVMTLFPGDVIATGTPDGVGKLAVGDHVELRISKVGALDMDVSSTEPGK